MTPARTVAVLGLGNVLLGDDGIGPFVIEMLRAGHELPDNVSIADLGTPGLGLPAYLSESDAVILIDAVAAAGVPGEVRLYRREDIDDVPRKPRVSPHDPAVQEALFLVDLAGRGPRDLLLIGIIPEQTTVGARMSESVRRACRPAIDAVLRELARLGVAAVPRRVAEVPDIWWAAN